MTNKHLKRWIIAVLIWLGAIGLFYADIEALHELTLQHRQNELSLMDTRYLERHAADIKEVLKKNESLAAPVETFNLGKLRLETKLKHQSRQYDLDIHNLRITERTANTARVDVDLHASMADFLRWLADVRQNDPYLLFERIHMQTESASNRLQISLLLGYCYRLTVSE